MAAPSMSAQAAANAIIKSNIVAPTVKAKPRADAENAGANANGSRPISKRKAPDATAGLAGAKRKPQETTLKKPAARSATSAAVVRPGATKAAAKPTAKVSAATLSGAGSAPKRPAWDLKGRLEDMESDYRTMQDRVRQTAESLSAISAQLVEKNVSVQQLNESKSQVVAQLEAHQRDMEVAANQAAQLNAVIAQLKVQHTADIDSYASKLRNLELDLDQLRIRLRVTSEELDRTKAQLASVNEALAQTETALKQSRTELAAAHTNIEGKNTKIEELQIKISEQEERIKELERKTREDEKLRRKLHNAIQELKGNIRVYCRVRPAKGTDEVTQTFAFLDDRSMEATAAPEKNALGKAKAEGRKWNFQFDKVFSHASTQEQVFVEVSQLVQSALDGYNTCIFAYGQTGSGKTFTMEGPEDADDKTKGVIPRSVEQVFTTAREMEEQGWSFEMEASFLEIYNETIQDLLCTSTQAADREYKIIHDQKGNTSVTDLTVVKVVRPSQVYELLKRAAKNRSVGATKMNERSSRSHSVFQMRIKGRNSISSEEVKGLLNLIDLAGSERLDSSGATGDRLTETKNINKSLSCLADVISALATKEQHVPYRNSKLTYLLQNSLGGNRSDAMHRSKTLMFVNVSPSEKDLPESLNSLRFATKVNACDIGTAKKTAKVDLKV